MIQDGKSLSIIIPVHNKYNFTKSCFDDLHKLYCKPEIIIVDNGSTDETQNIPSSLLQDSSVNSIYLRQHTNLGFAAACNIGYKASSGDYIMFLNNDIRVKSNHENWTDDIIKECNDDILVGPTAGVLDNDFNFIKEVNKIEGKHNYMSGWNLSANKKTWDKLIINNYCGPFSEEFGLAYFEDTDLSFRAKLLGFNFKIVDVPVVHFGKVTSKSLNTIALYSAAKQKFIKKWRK